MPHLNRVSQIGRLTRDVEIRTTSNGTIIGKFGIANNERKKNATTGQWEDGQPMFIDVTCFGWLAEHARDNFRKGMEVHIEGRLQLEQWQDKATNANRSKHSLIADLAYGVLWKAKGGTQAPQQEPANDDNGTDRQPSNPAEDITFAFWLACIASAATMFM